MRLFKLLIVMGLLALAGLFFSASQGHADFYKWVDKNGMIWLTDDPESLPEEARDQFEKVMTTEKSPPSPSEDSGKSADEGGELPAVGVYLENRDQELEEIDKLKTEISTLEQDLAAAKRALKRVSLTDRRGYWPFGVPKPGQPCPEVHGPESQTREDGSYRIWRNSRVNWTRQERSSQRSLVAFSIFLASLDQDRGCRWGCVSP
jgi:hypothetical protein